jgi:multiple sugar transport system ATP-binding protein
MSETGEGGAFLELRGVTKRFGHGRHGTTALDGVDLTVNPGEIVVVLGPTGAGKTTLLRTIAGLEAPEAGSITLGGADALALSPAERDVALVFQNFSLYPHLTVRGNLEFPLRAPGRLRNTQEIGERVEWAAKLLRIERLLDRPAKALSGGEMQRVAIGRALVRRPKLFLLDEPLTNLDAKLRESLRVELVRLFRELGTPVVHVTHDQAEALAMADRVVVLSRGRVLQCGTPREVYLEPTSPEVARQLGQPPINLIDVELHGSWWLTSGGLPLVHSAEVESRRVASGVSNADGTRALLAIRPEHVDVTSGLQPAKVSVVEDAGPHRVLLVELGGATLHVIVPRDHPAKPGSTVLPRIDATRARLWAR